MNDGTFDLIDRAVRHTDITRGMSVKVQVDASNGHRFLRGRCIRCFVPMPNFRAALAPCACTCSDSAIDPACPVHERLRRGVEAMQQR